MRSRVATVTVSTFIACALQGVVAVGAAPQEQHGIQIGPEQVQYAIVESMADVEARARIFGTDVPFNPKARNGANGVWMVPSSRTTYFPKSGQHYAINQWGDTRMGVGFGRPVTVKGAYFAGQGNDGAWTSGVRALGYRNGQVVAVSGWLTDLSDTPKWLAMNFVDVDRIEIEAQAVVADGAGWYGMDDLTYAVTAADGSVKTTVVDFEDTSFGAKLTGSGYAGLTWELGTGDFSPVTVMPPPIGAFGPIKPATPAGAGAPAGVLRGGLGTAPTLADNFGTTNQFAAQGATAIPPDTCGAIGPNHFVALVNSNISIYRKTIPHNRIFNQATSNFLPGSSGDGRVLFDQDSQRWILLNTDFGGLLFIAVSLTDDPTGSWFKTALNVQVGADVNRTIDFPTLGVDANGIYSSAFMVGATTNFSIFAIEKAPLVNMSTIGAATAFQNQTSVFEGALQPVQTYGAAPGEYYVSRLDVNNLRIRRVDPPITAPTISTLADPAVAFHLDPPNAPSLGSGVNIDTGDARISHTPVFRNGFIYAAHTINSGGRAAAQWFKIDTGSLTVVDSGIVSDPSLHFYYAHVSVNVCGDLVMGFSGSDANQFIGTYYTGRRSTDPAGQMSVPVQYQPGLAGYTATDQFGRNRWGDYSAVTLDPSDDQTFWAIQEYARSPSSRWGTQTAVLTYPSCVGITDCNNNGVDDAIDIAGATSNDCNNNAVPDECDIAGATSNDCNADAIPDDCQLAGNDCNNNMIPDDCELAGNDCNADMVPDDCQLAGNDCNTNMIPDECDAPGDQNGDGVADDADLIVLAGCLDGPGVPVTAMCQCKLDQDGDTDLDLADFAQLQGVITGQ